MMHDANSQIKKGISGRRSQSWYVDYIVSFVIFAIALFMLIENLPQMESESLDSISIEANVLSDSLLSEGNPANWNSTDVIEIGLLTQGVIDDSKVYRLNSVSYKGARALYGMRSEFLIYFDKGGKLYNISLFQYYGAPGANMTNIDSMFRPRQIVHSRRLTSYKGDIIAMNVVVWSR